MRHSRSKSRRHVKIDLGPLVARQSTLPARRRTAGQWALARRGRLSLAVAAASLGPAGEILSLADDGWKTALALGATGATAAGAWGWTPGIGRWKRTLPGMRERITALSAPVTGSTLLAVMAATGGPELGEDPLWGLSWSWSLGYGIWAWRRAAGTRAAAPPLTEQMLIWNEHLAASDGAYPKSTLSDPVDTGNGWRGDVVMPRGKKFVLDPEAIASAYDVDVSLVAAERPRGVSPRRGRVTVMRRNPLQTGTLFGEHNVLDLKTGTAPIGLYYDAETTFYRFFLPGSGAVHSFVTGTSGSGKSRLLDALLGIERRCPLACSWVIDPQGGQSLPDWPEGVSVFAPSVEFGMLVLYAAEAVAADRSARYGSMRWIDDKGRERVGRSFFVPGDPDPLLSLTIDEAHKLLTHPVWGEEAARVIGYLAKEARKCGVKIRLANQSPNASELGGDTVIRDILQGGNNITLRSGSSATGKRAAGTALDGVDPGAIPREFPDGSSTGGLGYVAGPDGRVAMFRAANVEDPYGLAQEGQTTHIEDTALEIPLVKIVMEESVRFLACRARGERYEFDISLLIPEEPEDEEGATGKGSKKKRKAKVPQAPAAASPAPAAAPASPAGPASPPGTAEKITTYLAKLGRPAAPASIARALSLTGPQVRKCLTRMKDNPQAQVVNLEHGAWVHAAYADDYRTAA